MSRRYYLISIALCTMLLPGRAVAQESSPEETLKSKGLLKLSSTFTLPGESEIGRSVRSLETMKKKAFDAQQAVDAAQKKVDDKRTLIIAYVQKRRELRAQLQRVTAGETYNRLVFTLNELGDRVMLMQESKKEGEALEAARGESNKITEEYIELVLATRKAYDQLAEEYEQLAGQLEVARAIEEFNKTSTKAYQLGPGSIFVSYGKRLSVVEGSVLSEAIKLRRGSGRLWYVSVVFDGKNAQEMAIDTGASIVALPFTTAHAVGLAPTDEDPTIKLHMADGRVLDGKTVFAKTVRVGKFTVENVECAVMPPEMTNAAPLLGLSFLGNFSFKIDSDAGTLVMSKVEVPKTGSRSRR